MKKADTVAPDYIFKQGAIIICTEDFHEFVGVGIACCDFSPLPPEDIHQHKKRLAKEQGKSEFACSLYDVLVDLKLIAPLDLLTTPLDPCVEYYDRTRNI